MRSKWRSEFLCDLRVSLDADHLGAFSNLSEFTTPSEFTSLHSCIYRCLYPSSFLVCSRSLVARSVHSSVDQHHAQLQLLIFVHPPLCCLMLPVPPLSVPALMFIQHPALWWLLCLQWSVLDPTRRLSRYQSCPPKPSLCLSLTVCHL